MDKVEALLNKINLEVPLIVDSAMVEYELYDKWESSSLGNKHEWRTSPVNMLAFSPGEYLEYLLEKMNGNHEHAFTSFKNTERKIMQTVPHFDLKTNKISGFDFVINKYMITHLLANYGTLRLEEYLHEACKHEVGHIVDAFIELDGKGPDVRCEYYDKMGEAYERFDEWYAEQTPETMTTAQGRMEYFKIPFEQRANEYGHVDTELMFEILKEFDKFDEAYNERK